jgi:pyruvate formate lyase activating enzyme
MEVVFQGCDIRCPHCQNPDLWSFEGGKVTDTDEIIERLQLFEGFYDSVCFIGGEPTCEKEALLDIVRRVKLPKVLYTGRTYKDLYYEGYDKIADNCDIIVSGTYIEKYKTGKFPGSSNQEVHCKSAELLQKFMINKN